MLPSGFGQHHHRHPRGAIPASQRLVLITVLGSVVQWVGANSTYYEQDDKTDLEAVYEPGIMDTRDRVHETALSSQ